MFDGIVIIVVFGAVLFLAYVFTKFIGNKTKRVMGGKYITIIESVALGMDKQLHLIKVENQFVLIASAGKSIEFLTTLNMESYDEEKANDTSNNIFDFKSIFEKYIKQHKDKKNRSVYGSSESIIDDSEGDVFKSNLNRLKSIITFGDKHGMKDGDDNTNEK